MKNIIHFNWLISINIVLLIICAELFNDVNEAFIPFEIIFSFLFIMYLFCYICHYFTSFMKFLLLLGGILSINFFIRDGILSFLKIYSHFDMHLLLMNCIILLLIGIFGSSKNCKIVLSFVNKIHLLFSAELLLCSIIYNNDYPYSFVGNIIRFILCYCGIYIFIISIKFIYAFFSYIFFNDNKTMNKILK